MEMPRNHFKAALKAGHAQIGIWSHLCSPLSTEILAHSGFDWVVLDMEHSPNDLQEILAQLPVMESSPTMAVVRPPWNDMVTFKRLLDIGVKTLLVPYVQTQEEAELAVSYTRYPPHGVRGYAGAPRASGYGRIPNYAHQASDEICLLLQVETSQGLENLEAIAQVEGVDGVFIGPGDLSAALGHLGNPKHPEVLAVIEEAIARIVSTGKACGILTADESLAKRYLELGCTFVAVGADQNVLRDHSAALARKFKPE